MLRQRLLRRSRKGVVLTEAGLRLVGGSSARFSPWPSAPSEGSAGEAAALSGTCRMSLPPDLARLVLAPVADRVPEGEPGRHARHPPRRPAGCRSSRRGSTWWSGPGRSRIPSCAFRRLAPIPRRLVASPAFLGAHPPIKGTRRPRGPGGSRHSDAILSNGGSSGPGRRRIRSDPRGRVSFANSQSVLRDAAVAGIGIASLLDFLIEEDLAAGRLAAVLPQWSLAPITMTALWRRDRDHRALGEGAGWKVPAGADAAPVGQVFPELMVPSSRESP